MKTYGQIAYEAFTEQAQFHASRGKSGSSNASAVVTEAEQWTKLPYLVRQAWNAAGVKVAKVAFTNAATSKD